MSAIQVLVHFDTSRNFGVCLCIDEKIFLLNKDKILTDMISLSKEYRGVLELIEKTSMFGNDYYLIKIIFSGESSGTALSYFIKTLQLEDYELTSYLDYNYSGGSK